MWNKLDLALREDRKIKLKEAQSWINVLPGQKMENVIGVDGEICTTETSSKKTIERS